MKKNKLCFGLVAALLSLGALAACNEVTAAEGVVLTYTDANGERTEYTAVDLFGSYQVGTSVASTDFTKIKEVLIRKYYETGSGSSSLEALTKKAVQAVDGYRKEAKKNAESNGTSYAEEWEKILKSQNVENVDELLDKKIYEEEESDFKKHGFYGETPLVRNQARDGKAYKMNNGNPVYDDYGNPVLTENDFFPASDDFGIAKKGYIEDQMPYHVTHVLLPISGASETNATTGVITATEAKNLGEFLIKVATGLPGKNENSYNTTFNALAKDYPADPGSAAKFGDLGIMDFSTSFVQGFQYGVYAYDAYYNTTENAFADAKGLRNNLKPTADGKYYNKAGVEESIANAFAAGGIMENIGEIPFGAALALANEDVYSNFPNLGYRVNGGNESYFPRNIIFNKYFNTHKISVITPDSIPFNAYIEGNKANPNLDAQSAKAAMLTDEEHSDFTTEKNRGAANAYLDSYQGFSRKVSIGGVERNVLTTEKGQVILAVRGDSGTKGIHFIVLDRSPLSGYGTKLNEGTLVERTKEEYEANANTSDVTTLSEYYSFLNPVKDRASETFANDDAVKAEKAKGTKFPFYTVDTQDGKATHNKTTLVYAHVESTNADNYTSTIDSITSKISSYNSSLMDSYTFQKLFEDGNITFNENNEFGKRIASLIRSQSKSQRLTAMEDANDKKDEAWAKYIEFLVREEESRELRKDGGQKLISETCAISYLSNNAKNADKNDPLWGVGGACYAK